MSPIRLRQFTVLCRSAQWLLIGGAAWLVLESIVAPEPAGALALKSAPPAPVANRSSSSPHDLNQLRGIWTRDLRQALIQPKPKPVPKPKPPPPQPPPIKLPKLLATFVEQGRSWGLFVVQRGTHRVKSAGDQIGDFQIVRISAGAASLRRGKRSFDVHVPSAGGKRKSGSAKRGRR